MELRDVERLFHLEGEVELARKELSDLGNRRIVADLGEKEKIFQLQEEKKRKMRISELTS